MQISDIKNLEHDQTIDSISGTVTAAYNPEENNGQYGKKRSQRLELIDETGTVGLYIRTQVGKPPRWIQEFAIGDAFTFVSKTTQYGTTGIKFNKWTDKNGNPQSAAVVTGSAVFRGNSGGAANPVSGNSNSYSTPVNSQKFGVVEAGEIVKYFLELFGRPADANYVELVKSVACTVIIQASQNKIVLDYKEKKEEKKEEETPGPDAQDLGAPGSEDNMEDIPF